MANVAGRKKSMVASLPPSIDSPVANNTLLNKAASQSTSLYQQCSSLRTRLMHLQDFSDWFSVAAQPDSSRRSTDPVTQLWDVFALGVPLCYLYNLLPQSASSPIAVETDVLSFDRNNERTKKHAIALFAMNVKQVPGCEGFTVRDLWDRNSTDGFVKVVNNVINLVQQLPEDLFLESAPSSPALASALASTESLTSDNTLAASLMEPGGARANIIKELVDTERKYVQDLEVMQKYCDEAVSYLDRDTLHLLFPGLNKLLNFQRKFLIKVESIAELPWNDQRWGLPFTENEEEFAVYEPYCANYTMASEIMLQEEHNLTALNHIINVKGELPAFLIKPVQRICKYPLLLESLVKAVSNTDYPYIDELKAGVESAKRITDKINEAQRRAENDATVKNLEGRVEDWKGHHISNFGALLLDDIFSVTKSEVDREYHVFLFEKIILCCKEYIPQPGNGKKVGKSNSILKKPTSPSTVLGSTAAGSSSKKKNTPLLLKGRIFLNNVTQAVPKVSQGQYSLAVWWRGDDDLEFFTLRCRNEEQLKHWENQLNRLIKETANRRTSDRNIARLAQVANSTSPSPQIRSAHSSYAQERSSMFSNGSSGYASGVPQTASINGRMRHPYASGEHAVPSSSHPYTNGFAHVHQDYPHDGFEADQDDEYEDYPPASAGSPSGRGTPMGQSRRPDFPYPQSARHSGHATSPIMSGGVGGFQGPASARPVMSRNTNSYASDASFGNAPPPPRPGLRSQFSSTRLRSAYDGAESRGASPMPTPNMHQPMRSRSISQPQAYHPSPQQAPPPLPTSTRAEWSQGSLLSNKRGSGSSQSTDSADYSPHTSSSPITPYGSSESSLAGMSTGRSARGHIDQMPPPALKDELRLSPPVKIKVHFNEDIFVIQVPRSTEYYELVDKVGKKIRLCGPRRDDGPLRVKYKDEDGDLVSLGSTEDVQMAFESLRPGNQVTLYVQ
ncbi:hypothetical protein BD309DRAFT_398754 [Dichomitus squalens]|uniref:Uncharacterized protein n=1 Tax=Dichomitus squalens TaxID=114155 RepID=A0A4Q9QAA7_9APHY|nr:uncharacterized protein DICSQDRAFT_177799 [Dichomitus squalens LYAD-421 SS1]EJF65139.1 hypothetical protein DICSQDRAFT_177799 [Dichomitus squalens LYAD-421 SS1]TBU39827.1 hypothetical protein BD309DRAFT_398754 [Dichomitus squalens]TBU64572.1 hypothetical protein BD310DRAFT_972913 [Dichomitus squalens]